MYDGETQFSYLESTTFEATSNWTVDLAYWLASNID